MKTLGKLKVRDSILLEISCYAPEELFLNWDDVPDVLKNEVEKNGSIPCEGSGAVGQWCLDCRFGEGEEC